MWEDLSTEEQTAISDCLNIFDKWSKRGAITGQIKDKYGTTRWYAYLGTEISLNTVFYPKHIFNRMPKWTYRFDRFIFQPVANFLFGRIFTKWQIFCYKQAYKECYRKYPMYDFHCVDHHELVDQYIPVKMWKQRIKEKDDYKYELVEELLVEVIEAKDDNIKLNELLIEWKKIYLD